jgi:hypothetical protein
MYLLQYSIEAWFISVSICHWLSPSFFLFSSLTLFLSLPLYFVLSYSDNIDYFSSIFTFQALGLLIPLVGMTA